jgi:hypothetical protein
MRPPPAKAGHLYLANPYRPSHVFQVITFLQWVPLIWPHQSTPEEIMKYLVEMDSDRLFLEMVLEQFGGRVLAHLPQSHADLKNIKGCRAESGFERFREPVFQAITSG